MVKNRKLIGTERLNHPIEGAGWVVRFSYEDTDGRTRTAGHFIPLKAFAARAVEYDIDPADVDTILDILLAEIFIPEDEIDFATTVYGPASNEETRKAHLARCARVKLRHRWSTRSNRSVLRKKADDPDDPTTHADVEAPHPLDDIRDHLRENPHPEGYLNHLRAHVERNRQFPAGRMPQ